MTTRTTGRIFNIIVDGYIERVKGGKLDRYSVTVCRYDNDDVDDLGWTSRGYPRKYPITAATRRRLTKYAPLAPTNRKQMVSAYALITQRVTEMMPANAQG